jgi:hypothetical protein
MSRVSVIWWLPYQRQAKRIGPTQNMEPVGGLPWTTFPQRQSKGQTLIPKAIRFMRGAGMS